MLLYINLIYYLNLNWGLGIVDWGLGPIPNPQSPIPKKLKSNTLIFYEYLQIP